MAKDKQAASGKRYARPQISRVEQLSAQLLLSNERLALANEKMRQSEIARNEVLANLSHDLRAPLTALRSAVDYMHSQPDISREDQQAMLAVMDRRCAILEHMAEDLYLLMVMDLPSYRLQLIPLDLEPFLEEYYEMQRLHSAYGERQLLCNIPPGTATLVQADPKSLMRVLDNLFSNALKFTLPGDQIILGCKLLEQQVAIYVQDTGSGIPPDKLETVFERTYTLSDARTPNTGSGLGLSIVRSIVEKHGGRVWCKSAPGLGSTFTVSLPIASG